MRVLWVFDRLHPAWQQVANRLVQGGDCSLEIMARYDEPPQLATSIPLTQLSCHSKIDFKARQKIRQKIISGRFDIAHAYTSRNLANLIGASRGLRHKPKIVGYRGTTNRLRALDPCNWISFLNPSVSKITCVSQASERALRQSGIPQSKLAAVVEGCDLDGFREPDPSEIRDFNIPQDAFVVGAVANMRPVKGIDLLLRAALELTDLRNIYWLLIGKVSDPRIPELAADPRISNRVRLVGPRPIGLRHAESFDIIASPSRMEGFGNAVLEAMAQKVCPVVSNVGGLTELIKDGVHGLVVPPEDPGALADAIRLLYCDSKWRRQLAESAQRRTLHEFSIEAWGQRLALVYQELAEKPAPRGCSQLSNVVSLELERRCCVWLRVIGGKSLGWPRISSQIDCQIPPRTAVRKSTMCWPVSPCQRMPDCFRR